MGASRLRARGLESGRCVAEEDKEERPERACAQCEAGEAAGGVRLGQDRRDREWRRRAHRRREGMTRGADTGLAVGGVALGVAVPDTDDRDRPDGRRRDCGAHLAHRG